MQLFITVRLVLLVGCAFIQKQLSSGEHIHQERGGVGWNEMGIEPPTLKLVGDFTLLRWLR